MTPQERAAVNRLCMTGDARRLRQSLGLTLRDIAHACGVSVPAVSLWERGQRLPSAARAEKLATVFADLLRDSQR